VSPALPFSRTSNLAPSDSESDAFGFEVARLSIGGNWHRDAGSSNALVSNVIEVLDAEPVDTVIIRFPSDFVALASLAETATRRLHHAGTLVYWEDPLVNDGPSSPKGRLEISPSGTEPTSAFVADAVALIADSFAGYVNHYSYNGRIPNDVAQAGYVDWTRRTIADPSGIGVVVHDETGPVAVATVRLHTDDEGTVAEVELAGVVRARQGSGWYATLWSGIREAVSAAGASRLIISTQVSNVRVQRAWARLGMVPLAAFDTVHAERHHVGEL